jgi:hypothetical protein
VGILELIRKASNASSTVWMFQKTLKKNFVGSPHTTTRAFTQMGKILLRDYPKVLILKLY